MRILELRRNKIDGEKVIEIYCYADNKDCEVFQVHRTDELIKIVIYAESGQGILAYKKKDKMYLTLIKWIMSQTKAKKLLNYLSDHGYAFEIY